MTNFNSGTLPGWYPVSFDPNRSILAGLSTLQLQQNLAAAQNALNLLLIGGKPIEAEYNMVDGVQKIKFTPADQAALTGYIMLLQAQLGINRVPRRPINIIY